MSKPVYVTVSDEPVATFVRPATVISGIAEQGTPEQLRQLAKTLLNAWIMEYRP